MTTQSESTMTSRAKFLKFAALAVSAVGTLALTGCETAEDRQLAAGQACLDNARTATDADQCISIVQGLESEYAYLIRCSANFVAQGFTGTRVSQAFQGLKDDQGSGGNDPMAKMMAFLVFANTSPNHEINTLVRNCQRSGVTSMIRLSTAANLATTIANLAGGGLTGTIDPTDPSFNEAEIRTRIDNLVNSPDPTKNEAIGTIAQSAATSYCNEGSSYKDTEICKNLETAISGANGNTAAIGLALLQQLQQNN